MGLILPIHTSTNFENCHNKFLLGALCINSHRKCGLLTSSKSDIFSRKSLTPRPSNLTNAKIYSLHSLRNPNYADHFAFDEEDNGQRLNNKRNMVSKVERIVLKSCMLYRFNEFSFTNRPVSSDIDLEGPVLTRLGWSSTAVLNHKPGAAQGEALCHLPVYACDNRQVIVIDSDAGPGMAILVSVCISNLTEKIL
ncbi:hypothetical protein ACFE04_029933 [Oxalis oulophora]